MEFISAPQFSSMASMLALLSAGTRRCLEFAPFLGTSLAFNYFPGQSLLTNLKKKKAASFGKGNKFCVFSLLLTLLLSSSRYASEELNFPFLEACVT